MAKSLYFRKALPVAIITAFMSVFSCNSTKLQSIWTESPPVINGDISDWANIPITFDQENKRGLGLANDSQAVYILIRFADPQWAQQIRRGGMTIWLDETGGREQRFGLRYNGGPAPSDSNHAFPMNIPPQRAEQMRENLKPRPERLIVVDRRAEQLVPLDSANEYGLAAKYAFADGFYCYEVRIPLQIISADFYGIKTTAGQTIGLGIEWGGMNRFREEFGEKGGNFEGPDIPPGGGQGRRGGPGMPPGRPGMQLPEKQEFWLKLTTADGKESVQKIN